MKDKIKEPYVITNFLDDWSEDTDMRQAMERDILKVVNPLLGKQGNDYDAQVEIFGLKSELEALRETLEITKTSLETANMSSKEIQRMMIERITKALNG